MKLSTYIAKSDATLTSEWADFSPVVQEYIANYGLKQLMNDAHSAITTTSNPENQAEVALALAEAKLEQLIRGDLRVNRASLSPLDKEIERLWLAYIADATKQTIKTIKTWYAAKGKDAIREAVACKLGTSIAEVQEQLHKKASEYLESKENLGAAIVVDLSSLDDLDLIVD